MITKITSRHVELTDSLKEYAEKKVARLSKFHGRITEIEVVIDTDGKSSSKGNNYQIEVIVHTGDGAKPFVVHHTDEDAYACIDGVVDRSERQLLKYKEQTKHHKGKTGAGEASIEAIEE